MIDEFFDMSEKIEFLMSSNHKADIMETGLWNNTCVKKPGHGMKKIVEGRWQVHHDFKANLI